MFSRDDQHIALPATIIIMIGAVCVWASQASAQSREYNETMTEISLQTEQLEAKCDRQRSDLNDKLNTVLRKRCSARGCSSGKDALHGQEFSVEWNEQKRACGVPTEILKTSNGKTISRQELIDKILGYPCQNLRTRRDPAAVFSQCGLAPSAKPDPAYADAAAIANEINEARRAFGEAVGRKADNAGVSVSGMKTKMRNSSDLVMTSDSAQAAAKPRLPAGAASRTD